MAKPKSMTILGVRGLRAHERTPPFSRPTSWPECTDLVIRDAAVQAMLWEQSQLAWWPESDGIADHVFLVKQTSKWRQVFNRAMKRYEKEQKR